MNIVLKRKNGLDNLLGYTYETEDVLVSTPFKDIEGKIIFEDDMIKMVKSGELGQVFMDDERGAWSVRTDSEEFYLCDAVLEGLEVIQNESDRT